MEFRFKHASCRSALAVDQVRRHRARLMPFDQATSERLFSALAYALFAAPGIAVLTWMAWRLMAWCLFHVAGNSAWIARKGDAPRLFARSTSRAFSAVFLFCLALPLVFVPLRYLADRLEGPKILFWHWLLALVPIPLLAISLIARLRRKRDWRARL
jgi:hypothetical protein